MSSDFRRSLTSTQGARFPLFSAGQQMVILQGSFLRRAQLDRTRSYEKLSFWRNPSECISQRTLAATCCLELSQLESANRNSFDALPEGRDVPETTHTPESRKAFPSSAADPCFPPVSLQQPPPPPHSNGLAQKSQLRLSPSSTAPSTPRWFLGSVCAADFTPAAGYGTRGRRLGYHGMRDIEGLKSGQCRKQPLPFLSPSCVLSSSWGGSLPADSLASIPGVGRPERGESRGKEEQGGWAWERWILRYYCKVILQPS